ncbi:hypothetical protein [Chitinophaga japonensis]|uniref:Uncharacterized protein n=1 Tax=Chitinophaga japonensis TaxID=104662 RepID=A0A562SNY1_CHIJA|nr:hypothetical protein [Chitinophaga japonensis]TWI82400.1 hypothetical protein LX66_4972 [Chitinophaga japonensis]
MSTNEKKHYPPDAGKFISLKEADRLIKNYDEKEKKHGKKDFTKAYFFGKDKIKELLDCEGCVGIRIYYGVDLDGDGIDDKKMVIYAVNKEGKNMPYYPPKPKTAGLGFMSPAPDDGGDGDDGKALDEGLGCPSYCP